MAAVRTSRPAEYLGDGPGEELDEAEDVLDGVGDGGEDAVVGIFGGSEDLEGAVVGFPVWGSGGVVIGCWGGAGLDWSFVAVFGV